MRFCVKCGKDVQFPVDGLCVECYLSGRKFATLPYYVDLDVCAVCKEYYLKNKWVALDRRDAIEDAAIEELSLLEGSRILSIDTVVVKQDPKTFLVELKAHLMVQETQVESDASTTVRVKNTVCKRCSRVQGSYYEAILQVRSEERSVETETLDEVLHMVLNYVEQQSKINRQYFISKVEKMHGGVDFYISSLALGRMLEKMISDRYSGQTKESSKLVGRKPDGQDMYRVTYLVRLPEFKVGDVVIWKDNYYRLSRVFATGGRLTALKDFREVTLRKSDMPALKVYCKESELLDVAVISGSAPELQVLNPVNYETLDIRVPEDAVIGETVKATVVDDIMYFVK